MTVLSLPDSEKGVSAWLIHSSWTFEASQPLRHQLSSEVIVAIDSAIPKVDALPSDYKKWLQDQGKALKNWLDRFYSGTTYSLAIAHIIAADTILANILAGAIRFRLGIR